MGRVWQGEFITIPQSMSSPTGLEDPFPRWLTYVAVKSVGLSAGSSSGAVGQGPLPGAGWASSQQDGWVSKANVPIGPDGSCKSSYGPALEVPECSSAACNDQANLQGKLRFKRRIAIFQ